MYQGQRIALILLARSGSQRLPGKMLMPFGEGCVLSSAWTRLGQSRYVDEVVLATTAKPADDRIARLGSLAGLTVVRGSSDDVVARMVQATEALSRSADVLVRGCTDNPLVMPSVVDEGIAQLVDRGVDLTTPFEHATWPFGFGLVSMTSDCLARIDRDASEPVHREHVENFCFDHPEDFRIHYQASPPGLEYPELCATLDWPVDLQRLRRFEALLRGVPLEQQPKALIRSVRQTPLWIEGDRDCSPPEGAVALGIRGGSAHRRHRVHVLVDEFDWGEERRYGLRYVEGTSPIFLDRADNRRRERPADFLRRAAEEAGDALRAGPLRPLGLAGTAGTASQDKVLRAPARRGFQGPDQERFPERVILQLERGTLAQDLMERLMQELELHPDSRLAVQADSQRDAEAIVALARERLGGQRVARGDDSLPGDAFRDLVVSPAGRLTVSPDCLAGMLSEASLQRAWRSPEARRYRLRQLNGEVLS